MKHVFWIGVVLALCASVRGQETLPKVAPPTAIPFAAQKLTLTPPIGWRKSSLTQPGMIASFSAPDALGATLSVAFIDAPSQERLPDDLPKQVAKALKSRFPGFKQLKALRTKVQGADAWQLDGELIPDGSETPVRNRQVYVCYKERLYIFTVTATKPDFLRLLPSLNAVLKSVRWTD